MLAAVSGVRMWGDRTADHVYVAGVMATRAVRLGPDGDVLWSAQDTFPDVLTALELLPAPVTP
ncbi:hypothetical protein ADK67_44255 [Saccharothrix sp. NRRL B-16348]|nr:hypothetical protein ADK67_44255 [Saccharothrix sp. NRRL B-16348]